MELDLLTHAWKRGLRFFRRLRRRGRVRSRL